MVRTSEERQASADAVGLVPWWKKPLKDDEARDLQRARRDGHYEADVPRSLQATRCMIPASGYYEWQDTPDGKQPHYFTAPTVR